MTSVLLMMWHTKKYFASLVLALSSLTSISQSSVWSLLSLVSYEKQYDENLGMQVDIPTVNSVVMSMDGTDIEVSGYIIPIDGKVKQSHFVFSSFPANLCFFCGKAGPETAMEVFMADGKRVAYSDDKIKLKGRLQVKASDGSSLMYVLHEAVLL